MKRYSLIGLAALAILILLTTGLTNLRSAKTPREAVDRLFATSKSDLDHNVMDEDPPERIGMGVDRDEFAFYQQALLDGCKFKTSYNLLPNEFGADVEVNLSSRFMIGEHATPYPEGAVSARYVFHTKDYGFPGGWCVESMTVVSPIYPPQERANGMKQIRKNFRILRGEE
jgi:hypothetical protein